ncbi:hypothetical protein [Pseudomonas phage R12]|uniref:Uncharacterized protein n=1 Tax=Pseudomonas phage R12 TaxID=2562635 RepID=A0A455XGE5_9CAUD|nr:hypothetical protein HWB17_gp33 [Pseudomonas phage R12]BBJ26643.1 hypothetical protein [Pseudomonas phage R12]
MRLELLGIMFCCGARKTSMSIRTAASIVVILVGLLTACLN